MLIHSADKFYIFPSLSDKISHPPLNFFETLIFEIYSISKNVYNFNLKHFDILIIKL